jgi:hypothetical protein
MSRIENAISAIIGLLSVPVMLLNIGGGIVGGIWLAILDFFDIAPKRTISALSGSPSICKGELPL